MIILELLSVIVGIARCIDENELDDNTVIYLLECIQRNNINDVIPLKELKNKVSGECATCPIQCERHQNMNIDSYLNLEPSLKEVRKEILIYLMNNDLTTFICNKEIKDKICVLLMYIGEFYVSKAVLEQLLSDLKKEIYNEITRRKN